MESIYYEMIFKRKSFHIFKEIVPLSNYEIELIEEKMKQLQPLIADIKVDFRIVEKSQTTCRRGEYCVLIYSERKGNYLQNVGYLGEQLDLWLAANNIGVCWYGMGNPVEPSYHGLEFVIMLAIGKTGEKNFRRDYKKSKRRTVEEIWTGEQYGAVSEVIRYAPSACNSQPWLIEYYENHLSLYRVKGKRGIMPQKKVSYYNCIDIGIMMCFLDICLNKEGRNFTRELYDDHNSGENKVVNAVYEFEQVVNGLRFTPMELRI